MSARDSFVVVGAFGIDTNVYPMGGRVDVETTFASTTDGLGQAGCYSSLAAAALDVPTRAIAAIGDDRAGAWVREALTAAGVGLIELRDQRGTHRSVNIMSADGRRRSYYDPRGAGETIVDLEACRAVLEGARVVHVHLEDWCRRILPLAREAGATISCDLQDVADIDDPYRADFVAAADVVFMSATNLDDPAGAARELAGRRQGRTVVVGAGATGCIVAHGSSVEHIAAVDLPDTMVVDTNGAGDNLAVGFLVAYVMDGLPLEQAVWQAQLGARWICAQPGDHKRPLTRPQLAAFVRQTA